MRVLSLLIALSLASSGQVMAGDCSDMLPLEAASRVAHPVQALDLVRLRDFGPMGNGDARSPLLSLSPDGDKVALQLRRADPASNSYCFGMVVVELGSGVRPKLINFGGDYMLNTGSGFGFASSVPAGVPKVITPKWSPDGHWIAFLRRDKGVTQVWRAKVDGSLSEFLTRGDADVEDFAWTEGGRALVFSTRPDIAKAAEAFESEGESGFLYDLRFIPNVSNRPLVREPISTRIQTVAVASKEIRDASNEERLALGGSQNLNAPEGALISARSDKGIWTWSALSDASNVTSATNLNVGRPAGSTVTCKYAVCDAAVALWWQDARSVLYLRRQGVRQGGMALYRWGVNRSKPRLIWQGRDVLLGCLLRNQTLICAQESALQPRRLVQIDLRTGKLAALFDPNPEWAGLQKGSVERLEWKNEEGIETFGDLVLPPGHQRGHRLPLVIVQYESRGFLRGGTGDEYPIQAFAAQGFAVLSFQRPFNIGRYLGAKTWEDVSRIDRIGWADRRSVLSSLEVAIQRLVDQGIVDPDLVGLTGLSDGASGVQFALINATRFRAVAMSTCCDEPSSVNVLNGMAVGAEFRKVGYPALSVAATDFWDPVSLQTNAAKIKAPILLQLADREYLTALTGFTALKEAGRPVEMFVFPDEYHVKWQPAHRLANNERSLDWFLYWLQDRRSDDPNKAAQYLRWDKLKIEHMRASPG